MFWHAPENALLSKADFTEKRNTPSVETDVLLKALQHADKNAALCCCCNYYHHDFAFI